MLDKPKQKHPGGRPRDYTVELGIEICKRIAEGQSVNKLTRADDMPCSASVFNWLIDYPEFLEKYARAKNINVESLLDQVYEWCDEAIKNPVLVQAYKLKIDSLKWHISKLIPKKYGEKLSIDHKVTKPVKVTITPVKPK